jgi:hypothetical protein
MTKALVQDFDQVPGEPSEAVTPLDVPVDERDAARSKENIAQWTAYLPEDCVSTMIQMGWDVTT